MTNTSYTITHDRISPTADQVTEQGLRDYLAGMARTDEDWAGLADTVIQRCAGLYVTLDGVQTLVTQPVDTETVIVTNQHDNGFDIVAGRYVPGPVVGRIGWDDQGPGNRGFVLRIVGDDETYLFDDAIDAATILEEHGYVLSPESQAEIAGLGQAE